MEHSPSVFRRSTDIQPRRRRRTRSKAERIGVFLRSRMFLGALVAIAAFALITLHGLQSKGFVVDQISLGLLGFASLPFISSVVTSFKAGNVEFSFRDLSVHDQVFTFLDGIATKKQWTFYTPRAGEEPIGPAFVILTEDLVKNARSRILEQIRSWISSDDVNQRWFAAEIVGYHRLTELRRAIERAPETKDINERWQSWELNCAWAASCMEEPPYRGLVEFLSKTENADNQAWILKSFDQMIEAQPSQAGFLGHAASNLVDRLSQRGISPTAIAEMFDGLKHLQRAIRHPVVAQESVIAV